MSWSSRPNVGENTGVCKGDRCEEANDNLQTLAEHKDTAILEHGENQHICLEHLLGLQITKMSAQEEEDQSRKELQPRLLPLTPGQQPKKAAIALLLTHPRQVRPLFAPLPESHL